MSERDHKCPSCGEGVNPESKFCAHCGEALGREEDAAVDTGCKCPECGVTVDQDNLFCPSCGAPLRCEDGEATRDGHVEVEEALTSGGTGVSAEAPEAIPISDDAPLADAEVGRFGLLRVVSQEDFGREFLLGSEVVRIGKEADADISLHADSYMSHAHARILVRGGVPEIEDLGSRNGTYVQVRDRCRLIHGDRILIGATVLEYRGPVESEK